ncbi:MAG: hypothetical protein JW900_09870 [Anaerolineae bacterium]|nr:hypothetical protein [Anaerolineae bacterium]
MNQKRLLSRIVLLLILLGGLSSGPVLAQRPIRIVFLHHSCGENLINEGSVREGLTALGYEFYDHGYNGDGLRLADGSYSGVSFDVPGDNTDPGGLAETFAQPLHDPPDNAFSHLMQYDVIAFKSCFPVSNIADDYQLAEYQSYYLAIRERMDQYPDKVFIVVTQPPQVPGSSDDAEARRARALADWLQSDEYLGGHPNVFTFDFFGYLAGEDNFLRPEYRYDNYDAHPNERANRDIGPLFVDWIDRVVRSYDTGQPRPTPLPPPPAPPDEENGGDVAPPAVEPPVGAGVVDDFETMGYWEAAAGEGSAVECNADSGVAHGGTTSLHIYYLVEPYGWADCGRHFDELQDWSGGQGFSFWLRADRAGEPLTLMLFSGAPEAPTPFEVYVETTGESTTGWQYFFFPWEEFARAEWADAGGIDEIDPVRMTGYGIDFAAQDAAREGTVWIDDVALDGVVGAPPPADSGDAEPVPVPESLDVEDGNGEEEEPGGGLCASASFLPLGTVILLAICRRRRI